MCRGTESALSTASMQGAGDAEEDVSFAEEQLTRQVPILLDSMNKASTEANSLELRLDEAQQRYKERLAGWSELYDGLRVTQGREFAIVKPYYFASLELKATSHHMQVVAREFSEASLEYTRALADLDCDEAARLKLERDRLEALYGNCLGEYQAAQKALEGLRVHIGNAAISRTSPCLEMLQEQQMRLASEYNRINTLGARARAARGVYKESMGKLESISEAVHEVRRGVVQQPKE